MAHTSAKCRPTRSRHELDDPLFILLVASPLLATPLKSLAGPEDKSV
jgi:hypothetical protein